MCFFPIDRFPSWHSITCALLVAGAGFAVQAEEPSPAAAEPVAHGMAERLQALIDVLDEHGIIFDAEAGFDTVVSALISQADPLGGLKTPEAEAALEKHRAGRVYDVGIRLQFTNDHVRIKSVKPDSPAERAYIEPGYTLLKVDGTDTGKLGLFQLTRLLRSDQAEDVLLVMQADKEHIFTQRVWRAKSYLADIETSEALPFQLAYLQINRLREGTGARVVEILRAWADEGRYGILMDLRGADGEDLDSVKAIAELFAEPGALLFAFRDKDDQDLHVAHAGDGGPLTQPVMVLVDGKTGGAAEVLAAVLSDSVRGAMLFGQRTQGDMLVRETVTLPDGSRLYLATRRLATADGSVYMGKQGVRPDVVTARMDEDTSMYRPIRSARTEVLEEELEQEQLYHRLRGDAVLRRAADVLLGLKALNIRPRGNPASHTN